MYEYPKFEVEIERMIVAERLGWPAPGHAADDYGLGGNREYADLRRLSWSEARSVYNVEGQLIARIETAEDPDHEYEVVEEESAEAPDNIFGLDIGVASTVVALSAARCVPFSSCNAAAFGGHHHEEHPVVAFYSRPEMVGLLLECAHQADAGIVNCDTGEIIVYADDIRKMRAFAHALIERRSAFRVIRLSSRKVQARECASIVQQLKLL